MAQTIKIKRSTSNVSPTTLAAGELAYSFKADTKKLYIGDGSSVHAIGGQSYTDKLDLIEANADVTDATNVAAAGALMDSEVTNLADVKAFDTSDYATSAQGSTADAALPKSGGAMTGAITTNSTFDGRNVSTDGTKLDGIEAGADVTDATNVANAGALMLTGGTMTGDLQFGDTNKIKLGASGDFQLVHTTTGGSFIIDQGPGDLKLVTNGTGVVINGGGSTGGSATTNLAIFHSNGSAASGDEYYVQLNHGVNSNQKFRTASGGVEITGNIVVSDSLDINGSADISGSLTLGGDLNVTGNINSHNVTDLDVTDKTITVGVGQSAAASSDSGIIVDGANAKIIYEYNTSSSTGKFEIDQGTGTQAALLTAANWGSEYTGAVDGGTF
jgi:hypothetical protein